MPWARLRVPAHARAEVGTWGRRGGAAGEADGDRDLLLQQLAEFVLGGGAGEDAPRDQGIDVGRPEQQVDALRFRDVAIMRPVAAEARVRAGEGQATGVVAERVV